jgi:plastocyanin
MRVFDLRNANVACLCFILLAVFALGSTTVLVRGASNPTIWHVMVGGQSSDASIQALAFYPGVITVDVNDMVIWTSQSNEQHTVTFLSGTPPPDPLSEAAAAPAGGNYYDGKTLVSSGFIISGQNYNLTFTKAGVFLYICDIHPGMQGVIIVNSAGTPYPYTQSQYDSMAAKQLEIDLANGKTTSDNFQPAKTSGANGTTIYHLAAGISPNEEATTTLNPQHNSTASGTATLKIVGPGLLQVDVTVTGLAPNSIHPEHIHVGSCSLGGPILFPLNDLKAGSDGTASATTMVQGVLGIGESGWFVNVHTGPTLSGSGAVPVACGDISYSNPTVVAFLPKNLVIHSGDTVVWTQYGLNEIHTVSIVPSGQELPAFPSTQALIPAGNGTTFDQTKYFNSGVLYPGQSYVLTFAQPGNYTYVCLVHADINMVGHIQVLPQQTTTSMATTEQQQPSNLMSTYAIIAGVIIVILVVALAVAMRKRGRKQTQE